MGAGKIAELLGAAPGTAGNWGTLAGLGGMALGGYSGYNRAKQKQASFMDSDATFIAAALSHDSNLAYSDQQQLLALVRNMSEAQHKKIRDMIVQLGLGAAAAILVRMAGGGLLTSAAAGLAGGYLGGNAVNTATSAFDAFNNPGQPSNLGSPFFC